MLLGKSAPPTSPSMDPNVMTIKKKIQTKYKLPLLNWTALKPNQLKGTVFGELDDEKILNVPNCNSNYLNFNYFDLRQLINRS